MKTYLLTGGLGFIGYHLTKKILNEEPESKIIIYDAQKHYIPFNKSDWFFYQEYRLKGLNNNRIDIKRGDCNDRGLLKEIIDSEKPNVIIHLAALSIAGISNTYPTEAKLNILDSTAVLLDVLRTINYDIDRIVYISSSMVYGNFNKDYNGNIIPASEEQKCSPIGIYGAMKLSGEHLVKVYNHRFGIPFTIIRPSAVYGPTDCNRRVTEIFLKNGFNGIDLQVDNGGQHQLDFTFVEDTVDGIYLAANSKSALGEIFNITRGEGRKISELADIIIRKFPHIKITGSDLKPYRPNRGALSIKKANELLSYNPKNSLEEGIDKYYKFVKKIIQVR